MQPTEVLTPKLTVDEWGLLTELLQHEVQKLPVEIRHTDLRAARQLLHHRLDSAEVLLEKLRPVTEVNNG